MLILQQINHVAVHMRTPFINLNYQFRFYFIQIDTYEKLYVEVDEFKGVSMFDTWFCVDAKPFKQALLNIIKRWSYMFKQHLIDHVTNRWVHVSKDILFINRLLESISQTLFNDRLSL